MLGRGSFCVIWVIAHNSRAPIVAVAPFLVSFLSAKILARRIDIRVEVAARLQRNDAKFESGYWAACLP